LPTKVVAAQAVHELDCGQMAESNPLYFGDNLDVLRRYVRRPWSRRRCTIGLTVE
jgi:hypothetical protein